MSDESFFREVSEELRQDRLKSIWTRFGTVIISVIVAVILATVAYVGWERYSTAQANESGDRYLAAQDLVASGDTDGAVEAFRAIAADGWGAYPDLARMSIANAQALAGRNDEAIASYAEVASDGSIPESMREMADLRAAYLLVDHGSLADVRAKAERLTGDDNPLRYAARDAIGIAAWKAGDTDTARDLYQSIAESGDAPSGIAQRAGLIIGLIAANDPSGSAPAETTPSPAPETEADDAPAAQSNASSNEAEGTQQPAASTATTEEAAEQAPSGSDASDPSFGGTTSTGGTTSPQAGSTETSSQTTQPAQSDDGQSATLDAETGTATNGSEAAQPAGGTSEPDVGAAENAETVILPEPQADQGTETNQ